MAHALARIAASHAPGKPAERHVFTGMILCPNCGKHFKRVKNRGEREKYQLMNHHPAIISDEVFERVQKEKARRSNIEETETGYQRRKTHYSAKRDMGGKSSGEECRNNPGVEHGQD